MAQVRYLEATLERTVWGRIARVCIVWGLTVSLEASSRKVTNDTLAIKDTIMREKSNSRSPRPPHTDQGDLKKT